MERQDVAGRGWFVVQRLPSLGLSKIAFAATGLSLLAVIG